jgi:iron-sulfur cluster insertion protein
VGQREVFGQHLENHQLGRLQRKTMITLSESAVARIQDILAEENLPDLKLRVFVQGGGCSGMQYGFTLDQDVGEDDWALDVNGVQLLVDSMSGQYLQGAEIDFRDDAMGASFVIKNPNAQTTCGCGSSFSPF